MAEGALFDVASGIIRKLGNLALQEMVPTWGVKDEIKKLKETVSKISPVLQDAEEKQDNFAVKSWLERLEDVMLDVDDLLDDISTEVLRRDVMTQNNKKAKEVHIFFSKSNQLAYGLKMGHKVKAMRERLDAIAADGIHFHLEERSEERQVRFKAREQTHSVVCADDIIGREDDKKAVIVFLLNPNVKEDVSILPIVGIGGLGKTTLAQLVFNDEETKKHFEQKFWVCVPDTFDVKIIVKKILECATKKKETENLQMETLVDDLRKEINGKRYLIVLDDVWNEDGEKWLNLKKILMGGARGSRILVTTRSIIVAEITHTVEPYFLHGLNGQQSWSLFKKMAFVEGGEPKNTRFAEIGKEILEKCSGLPLAIRTIGRLLNFKEFEVEWLSFKNNELSKILQNESDILRTLKLSYDHLPSHLKQCFAYCSLFPKNYEIDKSSLIKMWIAQGFITLHVEKQSLEDVGHEYFMDLLWRSFFQEVKEDDFGNISQFKIHDLMHDIAILASGSKNITIYSQVERINQNTRHVSFGDTLCSASQIPISLYNARQIRTFLLPSQPNYGGGVRLDKSPYSTIVDSFKFIRLLDLHNMGIKRIPSSIKKLKHLRYLDLSRNGDIETLPNSIVNLHNLQTLKLSGCSKLKELPRDINKLVKLRHLEIDEYSGLTRMPSGLGQLTDLHTLSRFVMSEDTVDSVARTNGGLKELHELNKLSGNLSIENLRHGKDAALESKVANLKAKQLLDDLRLNWIEEDINEAGVGYDEMSLEALQPQPNLKRLSLSYYGGVRFPSWVLSLTNLVQFGLYSCKKCQHLPPLDQFSSLKSLTLSQLYSIEYISERDNSEDGLSDFSFFPSLEELRISNCPNLKGWWGRDFIEVGITTPITSKAVNSFPRLSDLNIQNCPQLTSMPLFPYVKELSLNNCSLKPLEQTMRMRMINMTASGNLASIPSSSSSILSACSFAPLSKLNFLSIKEMDEPLPEELLRNLISLRTLYLQKCPLPRGMRYLTALQDLYVKNSEVVDLSNNLDEMEWHGLRSLLSLHFIQLPKLISLPAGLQHLTSLQSLQILNCPDLRSLPKGIGGLRSLQTLDIWRCNKLLERCKRGTGEDWPNIAHIPNLKGDLSSPEEEDSGSTKSSLRMTQGATESPLLRNQGALESSLFKTQDAAESSLPTTQGSMESSLPKNQGATESSLRMIQVPTESPLLRSPGVLESSLLKTQDAVESSLPTTQVSIESSLPRTQDATESSLHITQGGVESPLLRTKGALESSLLKTQDAAESSLSRTQGSMESSLPRTQGATKSIEVYVRNTWSYQDELQDDSFKSMKVSGISELMEVTGLHSLKIEGCEALEFIPKEVIGSNPFLQHLYLINCCSLKSFPKGHPPTALKILYIQNCKKLEFRPPAKKRHQFALERLCIGSSCDSMISLPLGFPKLKSLSIWDCANLESLSMPEGIRKDLKSLEALEIRDCPKLVSFPEGGLPTPNLTSIWFSNCENLKQLPGQLHTLNSLRSMFINNCPELVSLPEGGLPSKLGLLSITFCDKLMLEGEWRLHELDCLRRLEIEGGCKNVVSIPDLPSNLNSLRISGLSNLEFLRLQNLTVLKTLEISCCNKLQSLPEEDLPSSLSFLCIKECSLLKPKLQNRRKRLF